MKRRKRRRIKTSIRMQYIQLDAAFFILFKTSSCEFMLVKIELVRYAKFHWRIDEDGR